MPNGPLRFILFANCMPVKGARRSAICDLQRGRIRFIPNALYELLVAPGGCEPGAARPQVDVRSKSQARIAEYYSVLIEEGYGMWTDEADRFPAISLEWRRPEAITNIVIDIDKTSEHNWEKLRGELDKAGCLAAELRCYDRMPLARLATIISALSGGKLRDILLIVPFEEESSRGNLEAFCQEWPIVSAITVHSSPVAEVIALSTDARILYTRQELRPDSCGHVSVDTMAVNLVHVTEAQQWNTCLNRKLGVAADGRIGSCPACPNKRESSGLSLKELAAEFGLQTITRITKDEVKVCQDCEFRYVCTDCRVFITDPLDIYSKPANCSYDPYTATWGESGQ